MSESFSLKKFLDMSPHAWTKVFGLGLKVVILILFVMGILFIKNMLFPPAPANVNTPEIHVASGGQLHYEVVQQSEKKRPWWVPTPFVELFGEVKTDEDNPAVGSRFGGRWEF